MPMCNFIIGGRPWFTEFRRHADRVVEVAWVKPIRMMEYVERDECNPMTEQAPLYTLIFECRYFNDQHGARVYEYHMIDIQGVSRKE